MPGYDRDQFVGLDNERDKRLICDVCLGIFKDPVVTKCAHTFCRTCIENVLKTRTDCPSCKQMMTTEVGADTLPTEVIISSDRGDYVFGKCMIVNGFVNELRIKCDKVSNGCQTIVQLGHLSDHMNVCGYNICHKCGFVLGKPNLHNCIQLMRNDRDIWRKRCRERDEVVKRLQEVIVRLTGEEGGEANPDQEDIGSEV